MPRDPWSKAPLPQALPGLRKGLLAWYDKHFRPLPWRNTGDPYKVLVSEFMLQQTQVATVLPHFERFVKRFPTLRSLDRAREEQVLAAWSGLGYYRRARNLKRTAETLVRDHGEAYPQSVTALKELPGVGDYTARALASLIHGLPEGVVDGNVIRVLSRLAAWPYPVTTAKSRAFFQDLADRLVPRKRAGDWNQALMELGATVCSPTSPSCGECPWKNRCQARTEGSPESYPVKGSAVQAVSMERALGIYAKSGRYFLVQRKGRQLDGSWELPGVEFQPGGKPRVRLKRKLKEITSRDFTVGRELAAATHNITNKRIRVRAFAVTLETPGKPLANGKWVARSGLDELFLSSLTRKILDQLD